MKIGQKEIQQILNNKVNIICHNMESKTNKCDRCDMENPTTSKYCRGCGYELPNFIDNSNNQGKDLENTDKQLYDKEIEINKKYTKKIRFVAIPFFILLYFITFVAISVFQDQFIHKGGYYMLMSFIYNFFILVTALIFSIVFVYKEKYLFAFYVFALGVVLALIVGFLYL